MDLKKEVCSNEIRDFRSDSMSDGSVENSRPARSVLSISSIMDQETAHLGQSKNLLISEYI